MLPDTPYILSPDAWSFIIGANYAAMRESLGVGLTDSPTFANLVVGGATTTGSTLVFGTNNGALPGGTSYGGHLGFSADFALRSTNTAGTAVYLQNSSSGNVSASLLVAGSAADQGAIKFVNYQSAPIILSPYNGVIEQRIGFTGAINPQTFNLYGTYSSVSSYARLAIACDTSGNATLTTQSTGTAGTVSINGVPVGLGKLNIADSVAIGTGALRPAGAGPGQGNVAIGYAALTAGNAQRFNVAVGGYALAANNGDNNTAIGIQALWQKTTGARDTAIGSFAGTFFAGGTGNNNVTSNDSVFIGADTKPLANNQTNQIVIGYDATGLGSNSVVLGNSTIDKTALRGNVGIGTTAPSQKLEVAGNGRFTGLYPYVDLKPDGWTLPFYFQAGVTSTGGAFGDYTAFTAPTGKGLVFLENITPRLTIVPTTGYVGINTTVPDARITIRDTTNNTNGVGQLLVQSSDASAVDKGGRFGLGGIYDGVGGVALFSEVAGLKENATSGNWAGYLTFRTRPAGGSITDRLRIDSTGNVGIGTTAPGYKLEVNGQVLASNFVAVQRTGGSVQAISMYARGAGDISNIGNPLGNGVAELSTNSPGLVIGTVGVASIVLGTNNTERVRILDTGNVGIGTTAPAAKLDVYLNPANNVLTEKIKLGTGFTVGNYSGSITALWLTDPTTPAVPSLLNYSLIANSSTLVLNGQTSLSFSVNTTTRATIDNAGNFGIGTTAPSSKLHVAETWNNAGTAFTAMQVAVTNTSSASGSKIFDLLSGTVTPTSKFSVDKDGIVSISAYAFGDYLTKTNKVRIGNNSSDAAEGVFIGSSSYFGFVTSSPDPNLPSTSRLYGDGAYAIGQRNGTNGQTFSVYGTYPGAAWERFSITAPTSGNVLLGTYKGTGGIARGLEIQTDGVTRLTIGTGGDVNLSNALVFGGSGQFRFLSSGVAFLTNAAQTDFGRLCLGGNTASFPAIKRSTVRIQAVLANDSGFTNIQGKLTTDTDYTATVVTPTGFLTLYDAQGIAYRVPCVLAP